MHSLLQRLPLLSLLSVALPSYAQFAHQATLEPVPLAPFQRVYVLVNVSTDQLWMAQPLADALQRGLAARAKTVAAEVQPLDPLALEPGPRQQQLRLFGPQAILYCRMESLERIVQGGFGGTGKFACDLYDARSDQALWRSWSTFLPNGSAIDKIMANLSARIIDQLGRERYL
jgi:hypothetical protein